MEYSGSPDDQVNMKDRDYLWLIGLFIVISTTALYQRTPTEEATSPTFRLVIDSGEVVHSTPSPITVLDGPDDQQALLKVNFENHTRAKIRVQYAVDEDPGEWSLNIGDSSSNNGWSGDSGHQTHDSEIQIKGTTMSVWGSDVMIKKEGRKLREERDFVRRGQTVEFEISDQTVQWRSPQASGEMRSPFLFALADQTDREGMANRDIYIGLNRVVAGTHRAGWGAASVEIEMIP